MKCTKAQSMMLDHLYDALNPREQQSLLKHLQACPACAEEFEAHKATISSFRQVDMEEPPPGLDRKIMAIAEDEVERQKPSPAWSLWIWKPALATVAAATLAIVIVINYLPVGKNAQMIAQAPSAGDARMMEKAMPLRKSRTAELKQKAPEPEMAIMEEHDVYRYREPERELQEEGRGYYNKEDNLRFDIAAADRVGADVSEGYVAGTKRARQTDAKPLTAPASPAPLSETKDEMSALGGLALADRDGFGSDSEAVSAPAGKEIVTATAKVFSEISREQEMQPAKKSGVTSEPEEAENGKLTFSGADKITDAAQTRLEKAQNEYLKGNTYFDDGDFNNAVTNYQRAIALLSGEQLVVMSEYRLGQSYQKLERFEQAISVYKEILNKYPDFPDAADVYTAIGECYLNLGKIDEAIENFKILIEKFPDKQELAEQKIEEAKSKQATENADESSAE